MIRVGTSGWIYKHWREIFYPKGLGQGKWFAHYVREFDTVEINYSFYRLPEPEAFDAWRRQAPPGFLYAVKASRYLTHMKKLADPADSLQRILERASRLDKSLGPILYQLPPHWRANLPRFEHFLSLLPQGYLHVVEFRDQSWLTDEVFVLMERYHVAHCIHDMWTVQVPLRVTAPPVYIRLHGDRSHAGDYTDDKLMDWAQHIKEWSAQKLDVYVYFNNDVGGHALKNARTLKQLLGLNGNSTLL